MTQSVDSCTCDECKAMCKNKPGWFKPGEAEAVAAFLGVNLQELFNTHLMPDSWELDDGSIKTLSPAIQGRKPGEYQYWSTGQCVFFQDGCCKIHAVKPYECRQAIHGAGNTGVHEEVALSWVDNQDQIDILRQNLPE